MPDIVGTILSEKAVSQFDDLNAKLALTVTGIEKLIAEGVEMNRVFSQTTGGFKKFNEETKQVDANTKAITSQAQQLEAVEAKLNATFTTTAEKLAQAKVASAEVNKQLRDQARDALGLTDAYDKLTREYNAAAKEARNLAVQFGANSKEAKAASDRALELDKRLKDADASVGRFNKNVGNYSGALKTLERGLTAVRGKMDEYMKSGNQNADVVAQLQKEESLLVQLLNSQANGFVAATGEIKENTKALQQLSAAGLEGTEVYRELFKTTADLKDETADLKTALNNAAPDDIAFNAAADAARGLVGVYGLAKSGAAAFGIENEALEETMVKLQAAETALQSIEAIRAVFKKENAVRQAISIGLQKVEVIQTNLQTAAESKNIVVKYAAVAAQKALNVATSAFGGPLLLVLGGIGLLLTSFDLFGKNVETAEEKLERLRKEMERTFDTVNKLNDTNIKEGNVAIAQLRTRFATEQEIRERNIQTLLQNQNRIKEALLKEGETYRQAAEYIQQVDEGRRGKVEENYNKQKEIVDRYNENLQAGLDIQRDIEVARLDNTREITEESIKARQENIDALKKQLETGASLQQATASNEYKTYEQRLSALREFGRIQAQLINAEARKQLLTPGQTPSQIRLIEAERSAAIIQSRRDTQKQIEELTRNYQQRELAAQVEISKITLQMISDRNQRIADNEEISVTARLEANKKYFDAQKALIVAQTDFELQNKTLLESERKAIQQKSNADLLNLQVDFLKKSKDINIAALDQSMQDTIRMNSTRVNKDLADLAQQREDGLINEKKYQEQKAEIEFKGAKNELNILINQTKAKITIREAEGGKIKDLLDELAEYEKQLNEASLQNTKDTEEKKRQARLDSASDFVQLSNNIFGAINEIAQIQFDTRRVQLEEETAAIDQKYQTEIEGINASALSEEEKTQKLQQAEILYNAQKQQQQLKLKQIERDRAKFERAMTIQRIIADTAAAIIGQLKATPFPAATPFIAAIAALGAAQLARVIATPLPAFAEGTDDAPGGLAWLGDGGRRELVQQPDGKTWITPDRPTIMNLPKHSIVYPDARKVMEAGIASSMAVNRQGRLIESPSLNTKSIEQKLDKLTTVIKNKAELNLNASKGGLTAVWKFGANSIKYTGDQIKF